MQRSLIKTTEYVTELLRPIQGGGQTPAKPWNMRGTSRIFLQLGDLLRDRGDCRLRSGSALLERNEQPVSDSAAENNEPEIRERTVAER